MTGDGFKWSHAAGTGPVVALVLALAIWPRPTLGQYQVVSADGKSSLRIGVLGQVQAEWLESPSGEDAAQNVFVRRLRLLIGAKLGEKVTLFLDTDSPNLGKAGADGRKNETGLYLQDLVITYSPREEVKLDAGLLLPPLAYHTGQGATSLLGIDYSPYGFLASGPTNSRVGRDYGAQFRGYLFGKHLEVRAAVLQGVRGVTGDRPFRTFGRLVYYPLEAQTELFYTGTTLGKRKLVGIGVSYDRQGDYSTAGGDLFIDLPVAGRNAVTLQADYWRHDGRSFLKELPRQEVRFVEAGFYFAAARAEPFVQLSDRDYADPARADERFYQMGVAFWPEAHRLSLKVGVGRFEKDKSPRRTQVLAQVQLLMF